VTLSIRNVAVISNELPLLSPGFRESVTAGHTYIKMATRHNKGALFNHLSSENYPHCELEECWGVISNEKYLRCELE